MQALGSQQNTLQYIILLYSLQFENHEACPKQNSTQVMVQEVSPLQESFLRLLLYLVWFLDPRCGVNFGKILSLFEIGLYTL